MMTSRSNEVSAMRALCRGDGWVGCPFTWRLLADLQPGGGHCVCSCHACRYVQAGWSHTAIQHQLLCDMQQQVSPAGCDQYSITLRTATVPIERHGADGGTLQGIRLACVMEGGFFSMQASSTPAQAWHRCCGPHTALCKPLRLIEPGRSPAAGTTGLSSAVPIAGNVLCGAAQPAGTVRACSRRALPSQTMLRWMLRL